jgi:hypothetical protein
MADVRGHAAQLRRVCARQDSADHRRYEVQGSSDTKLGRLSRYEAELRLLEWTKEVVVQPSPRELADNARQRSSVLSSVTVALYSHHNGLCALSQGRRVEEAE